MRELFGRKITGRAGPSGHSGPPGASGPSGFSGYDGGLRGESGRSEFSGPSGFSGAEGFSSRRPTDGCCCGFSGRGPDTATVTFTVNDKEWTDVCMFIKDGFQVEASPGDVLWTARGEQDGIGRKMTDIVTLSLVAKEDGSGKIVISVSDGSTYDVTKKALSITYGKPFERGICGGEPDDGLVWDSGNGHGPFEAKLKVFEKAKAKVTARDFSLEVPEDARYIMYYDGHFLMYFDAKETFGVDETERGLAHDAAFAAVVAAEWRRKCLLRTTLPAGQQACGCENCRMAEEWQKFYEATVETKPKPTPDA